MDNKHISMYSNQTTPFAFGCVLYLSISISAPLELR